MIIIQAIYFFLPAYFANMAPVLAAAIFKNEFNTPIDGGSTWKGKPLLGSHKTWRGLLTGIIIAILVVYYQKYLYGSSDYFHSISLLDYSKVSFLVFGFLLGLGALFGDAVKSFFKRRANVASGGNWPPFDQIDFVIGGLIFISLVFRPSLIIVITLLFISPILHILVNNIGYVLGLKKTRW